MPILRCFVSPATLETLKFEAAGTGETAERLAEKAIAEACRNVRRQDQLAQRAAAIGADR